MTQEYAAPEYQDQFDPHLVSSGKYQPRTQVDEEKFEIFKLSIAQTGGQERVDQHKRLLHSPGVHALGHSQLPTIF